MIRAKAAEKPAKTNKAEEPVKDAERMLAQAEKLVVKLQSKVVDQHGQFASALASQACR